jgi:hypothetical protein
MQVVKIYSSIKMDLFWLFVCLLIILTCVGSERSVRQLYERHIVENARCIVGGVRNKHLGAHVCIMCLTRRGIIL